MLEKVRIPEKILESLIQLDLNLFSIYSLMKELQGIKFAGII